MKFDKILQYQKIDQELMNLESEVAKSDERQKFAVAKSHLEGATEMIGKLKSEAGELLAGYAAMKEKIDALKDELDEFDGILDDVQDANEADHYLKMVASIAEKINALEKEANGAAAKICIVYIFKSTSSTLHLFVPDFYPIPSTLHYCRSCPSRSIIVTFFVSGSTLTVQ